MDDWEDRNRGPGGIRYGVWIPRDPNYVKKEAPEAPEPPKAPTNDWIKIKVVDDKSGVAIKNVYIILKTPDGNTEPDPYITRFSGEIESLGLQSGNCEISCDISDLTIDNTLVFVGMGNNPIERQCENPSKPDKNSDYASGRKYHIAIVEKHPVKTKETLDGVAKSAGMTWQELAKFNWGTDKPDEINKHLSDDVGCTKKTADGKNYIFDDSDSPGVIYIPKKWQQSGLATNQVHTVRVRKTLYVKDWIEIKLLDWENKPFANKGYVLRDNDGNEKTGTLDENGFARIESLDPSKKWEVRIKT